MRIVFLGNFLVDYSSENHWAASLTSLGHTVVKMQESVIPTDIVLEEALNSDMFVWVHTHTFKHIGSIPMDKLLKKLKKAGIPSVAYHLDLFMGIGRWKQYDHDPYLNSVEYFFTVDKFMAEWLNKNTKTKAFYIPAGVYDKECVMKSQQLVRYDIIFTGNKHYHKEYPYRGELIDFLHKTYGNKFIHIGGGGQVGQKRGMELNQIYRNAKIVVGDTLQLNFDYPYYFSDRLFEVPGRGGFQIFPDIKGVRDNYSEEEMVTYEHGNLDDLKKKIDYYLSHKYEREAMRFKAFERTKHDHTYIKRWEEILRIVNG